jgi:hypothetical protein
MSVDAWPGAAWLTLNATYTTYAETYPFARAAYTALPTRPFFQVEGYYENEHATTPRQLRAQAYWTLLGGGMGYVFGNCPAWGFGTPAASFCAEADRDWKAQLGSPGNLSMHYVRQLFATRNWQDLQPSTSGEILVEPSGAQGNVDNPVTAATPNRGLVVTYLPGARPISMDMRTIPSTASALWYDPTTGSTTDATSSPLGDTGQRQFSPPDRNAEGAPDWVLLIEAR